MKKQVSTHQNLLKENEELRLRLEEAEETLRAIRHGEIDALVVKGTNGHQVYTLKGADHTYRILIESMNEGAVTLDISGIILYCNTSFSKLIARDLEKVIGSNIESFIRHKDRNNFKTILSASQNKKNSIQEIYLMVKAKALPVLMSLSPLTLDSGQMGISMIVTNLAQQKKNEKLKALRKLTAQKLVHEKELRSNIEHLLEELKAQKNALQKEIVERKKLERQREDFISIATHELKTPVTSIKAYAQVLRYRFRKVSDTKSEEMVTKMDGQLNKLASLIADLLDITKIEGGRLQFHKNKFDLNELVLEIVEEMQRTTEKHTIVKELSVRKKINGDRERIGQVLTNLISNAIKYSPHSDTIIVRTSISDHEATIVVQDFGIGIPKDDHSKVFDRFYRAGGVKQETYPGLGLGLYISSEIVKRHNGRIWVESTNGKGSTFCFTLPIKRMKKAGKETSIIENDVYTKYPIKHKKERV